LIAISAGQPGSEWANVIGEFGIGTNNQASLRGNIAADEKALGTIHIAIGRNDIFGGQNMAAMHLDAVVNCPTVRVDGRLILQAGRLLISA
jgi:leucyl aminopeptidase (aminopeptidase T)